MEKVHESPRKSLSLDTLKDLLPVIGKQMHTTTDNIFSIYKGAGGIFLNERRASVKAGDFHVCPKVGDSLVFLLLPNPKEGMPTS